MSERSLELQTGYDEWAPIYEDDGNPLIAVEEQAMYDSPGRPCSFSGLRCLDAGCGTGRHSKRMVFDGAKEVHAMDISNGMLGRARQCLHSTAMDSASLTEVTFTRHDLLQSPWPVPQNYFDVVLCSLVFDHISANGLKAVLSSLAQSCRDGGEGIFSLTHPSVSLTRVRARFIDPVTQLVTNVGECHPHSACELAVMIQDAGFEILEQSEHGPDEAIAARIPRAEKYRGDKLLLMFRCRRIPRGWEFRAG